MRYFIFLLLLFSIDETTAQNLLVNGDFEEENICTEYNVSCAPEGWISTSSGFENYFKDPTRAYSGTHCIAIEAGVTNKRFNRTYFRTRLLCALRNGKQYRLEFFIKSYHPVTDSAGIYFSHYDFLFEKKVRYRMEPSLYVANDPAFKISADSSWQKVSLVYTASGDEGFITFGNFSKRDINGSTGMDKENHFFVFIDKVSLTPLDPEEQLCDGWQKTRNNIYDQNERHEYLRRLIKLYSNKPPEPPGLSKTTLLREDTLVLPDILFESGKAVLQPRSFLFLDSLCRSMQGKIVDSVLIEGHADSTGTFELNQALSLDRANAIADYLLNCASLFRTSIVTRGKGSDNPVADNNTAGGRQKNRRVEVYLYIRETD